MIVYLILALIGLMALWAHLGRSSGGLADRFRWLAYTLRTDIGSLTLAAADAVLKEDYKGPVVDQLNNANVLLAQVERNNEDFVGRRFVMALHVGRNSGVGARAEGGTLPTAGSQQYDNTFGPVRSMYARIQLSGQTIEAMSKDRGSFIRALRPEMEGATNDAKRDYCRQLWGTSNGRICGVNTVNSTTITPPGIRQDQLRHLDEGFLIDIGTAASPASIASGRSVTSVDYSAGSFVISGAAVNVTAGTHFISRHGAGGASDNSGNPGDGQIELTGLQTMVSATATLHTLAVATQPSWASRVDSNGGTARAISENLVTKQIMRTEITSGKMTELIIGSDGVFRSYANLLTTLKRFTQDIELKGGYSGISTTTVGSGRGASAKKLALTWDRDCPDGQLYGLNMGDFTFYELLDWEWMDKHGAVLVQVGDTDAYSATLKKYGDFACKRRNSQWVIQDITES